VAAFQKNGGAGQNQEILRHYKHSGEHSHHEQEFSLSEVTTAAYIHNRQIHHVRLSNALEASLVAIGKGAFRQSI
jgi:hypothetical protein